jgi:hypothetical protein
MSAATDVYKEQVYCLWHARRMTEDFGPEGRKLSQDEEAVRAECLGLLREQMTPAEQAEMEAWLIAHRPEIEPLDSDGWPRAPDPPKELMVVPVFMHHGEWAWFQGAPDGVRYILADESSSSVSRLSQEQLEAFLAQRLAAKDYVQAAVAEVALDRVAVSRETLMLVGHKGLEEFYSIMGACPTAPSVGKAVVERWLERKRSNLKDEALKQLEKWSKAQALRGPGSAEAQIVTGVELKEAAERLFGQVPTGSGEP